MIIGTEILLHNVKPYKSVRVSLTDNDGLVVVTGHNKDSRISKNQSNGSGKSMLFGAISNCRYSSAPSSTLKNSKKDMISKGSKIGFRFVTADGRKVQFTQHTKGWNIHINGEDQHVHRMDHQIAKMAELFPLSEEEFYAYTYLSSIQGQRVHFQVDKPSERLKFITSIFRLDDYDKMKKYFTMMLGKVKEEQIRFDVLESKMLSITTGLGKVNWSNDLRVEYDELSTKLKKISKRSTQLSDRKNELIAELAGLRTLLKSLTKLENMRGEIKEFDKVILTEKLKAAEAYEYYLRDKETFDTQSAKIKTRLDKLCYTGELPDIKALITEYKKFEARHDTLRQAVKDAKVHNDRMAKIEEQCTELRKEITALGFNSPKDIVVPKTLDEDLAAYKTTLKLRDLLDAKDCATCPTCQQSVDIKAIQKSVSVARKRIDELTAVRDAKALATRYKELKAKLEPVIDVSELSTKLTALTVRLEKLETRIDNAKTIKEVLASKADIRKPKEVPTVKKSASYYRKQIGALKEFIQLENEVGGNTYKSVNKTHADTTTCLETLDLDLKRISKKYTVMLERKSKLDLMFGEYTTLIRQRKELEAELDEVKPILAKRDMYKALERAWSAKGIKVNAANDIMALLESNLNKYSELIFAEPFQFRTYATESGIFCEVSRGNGTAPTDVRLMSGAESDSFKLLFLLSLLLMVDPARRTNFVVLDEPDSHMDEATRNIFINKFLPFLREVVPHVFLITPNDEHLYEDTTIWRVIKHKGVSKLVVGEH